MHIRRRRLRRIDARQHRHRDQRDHRLHHEAEGEQIRRPDIHGPLHELRAEHAGEHAAGHHPRHRLGTERGAGAVGGGEAVGLRHRAVEPAEERRDAEQHERAAQDGVGAEQAGQHAAAGADDEGDAAAIGARDRAGRQGAGGQADHKHRERHGRERHDPAPASRRRSSRWRKSPPNWRRSAPAPPPAAPHWTRAGVIGDFVGCSHVDHHLFPPGCGPMHSAALIPVTMAASLTRSTDANGRAPCERRTLDSRTARKPHKSRIRH